MSMPAEFKPWHCTDARRRFPVPHPKPNKHWEECHELVQQYDESMFRACKGEVDNLLIFAGLFSATVTSFTIESYQWLDKASDDQSMQILAHISRQLQQAFPNSSATAVVQPPPFSVSSSAIRINIFWFLSLTLSMATILIGILCMQWLREFKRDATRSHKNTISIRQMRFEGLQAWKVPLILSLLPILLQFALVLFFAGVLELLWARNFVVAVTISVASGFVMFILLATTALPALQYFYIADLNLRVPQCPYKSPQSWAFYLLSFRIIQLYRLIITWSAKIILVFRCRIPVTPEEIELAREPVSNPNVGLSQFGKLEAVHRDKNWNDYDIRWRYMRDATFFDEETGEPCKPEDGQDLINGLKWIDQTFSEDIDTVHLIFWCLRDLGTIQAAQMVSELDPDVSYLTGLLFPSGPHQPSFYEGLPVPDRQIREHIFTVFLWLHKHIHPSLNESYLERTIRLMNTSSKCIPNLALRQSENDLTDVSFDTHVQLFHSLKNIIAADVITKQNASEIWAFLNDLYVKDPSPPEPLLTITFEIFEQFNLWLGPPVDMPKFRERVETCVAGVTQVFTSMNGANVSTLRAESPSFFKLDRLVSQLNDSIGTLEHHSAVLRGLNKRKWPDLMRKLFPATVPTLYTHEAATEDPSRSETPHHADAGPVNLVNPNSEKSPFYSIFT